MTAPQRTRREFLALVGAGAVGGIALAACGSSPPPPKKPTGKLTFRSRPDLSPSAVDVHGPTGLPAPGFVFLSPGGPMIVRNDGTPVWFHPVNVASTNLKVQTYQGSPVLTWWEGKLILPDGYGTGDGVIMDTSYREIRRIRPVGLHEFLIDTAGIAWVTLYDKIHADLRAVGGPSRGEMLDTIVRGVDLATTKVVLEWHSAQHVDLSETHATFSKKAAFDPVHTNSIEVLADGNLLVSARNTWTLYKLDRSSGEIIWRLGGKKSDFTLGAGASFAWQHDARQQPNGQISLFDDEGDPPIGPQSRGLLLAVDEAAKKVTVAQVYTHPRKHLLAGSQGSMQLLPNGNVLVGWGAKPYWTEYHADGTVVLDAELKAGMSYRALKYHWHGTPAQPPDVAFRSTRNGFTAYASWNGATGIDSWEVLAGPSPHSLSQVGAAERTGFETPVTVRSRLLPAYGAVRARDSQGAVLGRSKAIKLHGSEATAPAATGHVSPQLWAIDRPVCSNLGMNQVDADFIPWVSFRTWPAP